MQRKNIFILLGIFALGLGLRLFILSQRGSLWFDEAFSAHFASMNLGQMLHYLRFENNPPLYFIFLHFWMKWFGGSDLAVRLPSLIFSLASFPLVYLIGRRLHSSTAGFFASFLLAISSFQIFYSTETRMYSLYLFLALISTYIFIILYLPNKTTNQSGVLAANLPPSHLLAVCLFFSLLLLIWIHITAWLIVAAFALYLFWQSRFKLKQFVIRHSNFVITLILLILSLLPWLVYFLQSKFLSQTAKGWYWFIPPPRNYFLDFAEIFLIFGQEHTFIVTLISILIIAIFWQTIKLLRFSPESKPSLVFLLCWLFLPLTVGFIFSTGVARYFIAISPAFYLLLGIGFAQLLEKYKNTQLNFIRWIIPVLFFILTVPDYPSLALMGNHQWNKLTQWIQDNEECGRKNPPAQAGVECKELILINPHSEILPFERYYKGTLPFVGLYPKDDSDDRDIRIVKTNWLSLNSKENLQRKMPEIVKDYDRVFLVTGGVDTTGRNLVPLWLWQNGWRLSKERLFSRQSVMLLSRFANPE